MAILMEQYIPGLYENGFITGLNATFNGNLTVLGTTTIAGISLTDLTVTGNTLIGNALADTLGVTGLTTFTAATLTGVGITLTVNALTSGTGMLITSSSTDTTARPLLKLTNSAAAATGTNGLEVANTSTGAAIKTTTGLTSTHFQKVATMGGVTLWVSDGTTANGALTGTAGDICFNAGSNKPEYCTATTSWTALV